MQRDSGGKASTPLFVRTGLLPEIGRCDESDVSCLEDRIPASFALCKIVIHGAIREAADEIGVEEAKFEKYYDHALAFVSWILWYEKIAVDTESLVAADN